MADSAPVMIWISDPDKIRYFFNGSWLRFTGRSQAQEYGFGWTETVHPDDIEHYLDTYRHSFDARQEFKIEYRIRRFDGKYFWLLDHGIPRNTTEGSFAGYIGSCMVMDDLTKTENVRYNHLSITALNREMALNEKLAAANEELATTNEELLSLNEELSNIQESVNKLNNELEDKVRARTEELSLSQQKLIKNVESLHNLVKQAPVGMCILKGEPLFVVEANDLFLEIIGKRRDQFKDSPYWVVNAEAASYYEPITKRVMATGETYHAQEHQITLIRDGHEETIHVDFVYEPIREVSGAVQSIMIVAIDITEKVRARQMIERSADKLSAANEELAAMNEEMIATNEDVATINEELAVSNEELAVANEELLEVQGRLQLANEQLTASESRLTMAIDAKHLGTWDWDIANNSQHLSAECNNIFGLPSNHFMTSEGFYNAVYPADKSHVQHELEKAISTERGPKYDATYRIIRNNDQALRWIRVQGKIHTNAENIAVRFIGTVLDITEDKQAEEKSAKLAAIIESSNDAIISKTLESVITSWNKSAEQMFGYSAAEMIGETIYKLIPMDRYQEEPTILQRLQNGEQVTHFETKRIRKDGQLIDVSLTISVVKDSLGNVIGLSKIARDITEKKLDEARKNDFIGMVSHELKTPLTSLTGLIQMANRKLKDSEDIFLPGAMEKAQVQVKRMTTMIDGFLNVSRLESGKMMINKNEFNLNDLILEVIRETEMTISSHQITFEAGSPLMVNADQDKINSVITNLISNAFKYSPNGDLIAIHSRQVGSSVEVSIKDHGIGVQPDDKEKLFERYYRVENNYTQHISGFGIGLYLSAEIVHRHDGKIWVESEVGFGSTFYFSLPGNF